MPTKPSQAKTPAKKPARGRPRTAEAREAVALALATGATVTDAAARVKVDPSTVYDWRKDPTFIARVGELRHELTERTLNMEAAYRVEALDRARLGLANPDDRIGVRAADVLLRNTARPIGLVTASEADGALITYLRSLGS